MIRLLPGVAAAAMFLLRPGSILTNGAAPSEPGYMWSRTDETLALMNQGHIVWRFNYGKQAPKPYFHPLSLVDGTQLTCLSPRDHVWHYALWFSWKELNEISYWEDISIRGKVYGQTSVASAEVTPEKDHSARIWMTLRYSPAGGPDVLREERSIRVSAPDEQGRYRVDWRATFTPAGSEPVLLKGGTAGGGYAGLSVRMAHDTRDWRLIDSEGREDLTGAGTAKNTHGKRARWMDFSILDNATGRLGGIAILEHPSSLRHPSQWHNVIDEKTPFGYFSPAPLWSEPYTLPAKHSVTVRYRVVVHPGRLDRQTIEQEWRRYSAEPFQ